MVEVVFEDADVGWVVSVCTGRLLISSLHFKMENDRLSDPPTPETRFSIVSCLVGGHIQVDIEEAVVIFIVKWREGDLGGG